MTITAEDIRQWRLAAGVSVRDAGKRTGFGSVSIGRLERGEEPLRQGVLEELRSAYGARHCTSRGATPGGRGLAERMRARLVEAGRIELASRLYGGEA